MKWQKRTSQPPAPDTPQSACIDAHVLSFASSHSWGHKSECRRAHFWWLAPLSVSVIKPWWGVEHAIDSAWVKKQKNNINGWKCTGKLSEQLGGGRSAQLAREADGMSTSDREMRLDPWKGWKPEKSLTAFLRMPFLCGGGEFWWNPKRCNSATGEAITSEHAVSFHLFFIGGTTWRASSKPKTASHPAGSSLWSNEWNDWFLICHLPVWQQILSTLGGESKSNYELSRFWTSFAPSKPPPLPP